MKLSRISLKEERTKQQKFWNLVAKDIASNFEFDYRKDERWTKAISESNGDKEKAKHRYLQLRKKMLLDQVIRDIEKLIVINIVIIIVFVLATSAFENIDLPSRYTKSPIPLPMVCQTQLTQPLHQILCP